MKTTTNGGRRETSGKPSEKKFSRRLGLLVAGGLGGLLLWWMFGGDYENDPRVVEIRQLQENARQRFSGAGGPSTMEEAREFVTSVEQIRERVENLPPHLQRAAASSSRNFFFASMRQRIDDYYEAPPSQRRQLLDRQIKQSDLMRKAFEEARQAREPAPAQAQSGGPQQGGTERRGGPPWANRSQDERNEWFKNRILDQTTPEQRAKYVEYRRAESERREQLGLPDGWPR